VFELDVIQAQRSGLGLPKLVDPQFNPVGDTKGKLTLTNYQDANMTLIQREDGVLYTLAGIPFDLESPMLPTTTLICCTRMRMGCSMRLTRGVGR
jgi:hypothetical protein